MLIDFLRMTFTLSREVDSSSSSNHEVIGRMQNALNVESELRQGEAREEEEGHERGKSQSVRNGSDRL